MKENETKYTPDMCEKAYSILATGGTHDAVFTALDISRETFYQWLGRGKYKNSKYFKKDLSDYIKKGESAGRAWLDEEIRKAAVGIGKYTGNPTLLIYQSKRRDTLPQLLPHLKNGTYKQKIDGIDDLLDEGSICIDTYEQLIRTIDRKLGALDKGRTIEIDQRFAQLERDIKEIKEERTGEGSPC